MQVREGDCADQRGRWLYKLERKFVQVREGIYMGQRGTLYRSEREVVQFIQGGFTGQRGSLYRTEGGCADQRGRWLCRSQRRLFRSEKEVVKVIGIGCADHTQGFYNHNLVYRYDGTRIDREEMKSLYRC